MYAMLATKENNQLNKFGTRQGRKKQLSSPSEERSNGGGGEQDAC
jgi:hypothetical protein